MKAIILAGGEGLRLRDIVKDIPKPMADIAGRPFLGYLILQLAKWDIKDIVLCVGYRKDIIESYFDDGRRWKVRITYSEEEMPLGTGGAIKKAVRLVDDEQFLVMNGDSILDLDFNRIIEFHEEQKGIATIALAYVDDASRYGKVEINSENEVIKFTEKSSVGSGFINAGVYVFNREIINYIPAGKVSLESKVLPNLIKRKLHGMLVKGFFVDIGKPQDFLALCENPEELLRACSLD